MFELERFRGIIFHDTEGWCKIWRKTGFCFEKWHEKFDKFSPEHLKVSKLVFWWDPFVQSRKCMSLKFTEELCLMTMKNDAKFESWHEEFDKFWLEHLKIWLIWPKYKMFELKKVQRGCVWWHWRSMQNLKENWLVLWKMTWGIWQICIGLNKWIAHLTKLLTRLTESLFLRYK